MPTLLQQLVTKPQKFASGHRTCRGCTAVPLVVRHILRATDKPVVVACATGCMEVTTTPYPETSWCVPWIHSTFENAAATICGVEAAYRSLKERGKFVSFLRDPKKAEDIKFVAFGGDGGTYDIGLQALSGALERKHNFIYVCYDNEAYMNCLSTSSLILTKEGLKKITEVERGDEIYAFDQKKHRLVIKKCTGVFNNGEKEVFELETNHHSIRATANHPFLVLKRNGRGKRNEFIWKKLEEISPGDEIVVLKKINPGRSYKFEFSNRIKIGDYKVTQLNEISLPCSSSPELMKYLGIYVGDGWVREQKGEIGFALPKDSKERNVLLDIQKKIFGGKIRESDMYVYINSVNLARFIDYLGFGKGARNKTLPAWVFTLTPKEKESFIEGLMLADGYKKGKSFRYVSASKDLLLRLRLLLQTISWRVGKIHWQKKKAGACVVKRKLLKDSEYGYICFSKRKRLNKQRIQKYLSQYKYRNFLIDNEYFDIEKVKIIKSVGIEPTLDLRVEGEHNFIANGIVVHNTGNQRSAATPEGAATTTTPAGRIGWGKPEVRKNLTEIVAAHNIPYVAQASIGHWVDLYNKAKKAFDTKGPSFINVLAPCTYGWKFPTDMGIEIAKLGVETNFWPLYEIEQGKYKLNYIPQKRKPITEFMKHQGRYKHLFTKDERNKIILEKIQKHIDDEWERLVRKCECFK
jgi:pyruvate/2-oxoacid:ferredoxin oxidoreductase beta subunit